MNDRVVMSELSLRGAAFGRASTENAMKAVQKPKLLPWLAHRAGLPEHAVDVLWNQALALAGVGHFEAVEPRRQVEAMQYLMLMLMLNHAGGMSASKTGRAGPALAATI